MSLTSVIVLLQVLRCKVLEVQFTYLKLHRLISVFLHEMVFVDVLFCEHFEVRFTYLAYHERIPFWYYFYLFLIVKLVPHLHSLSYSQRNIPLLTFLLTIMLIR